MTAAPRRWATELLYVWFHRLDPVDWWRKDPDIDAMLRRRFADDLVALGARPAGEFVGDRLTAQAAILLFDQLPRNLFRNSPLAYRHDAKARAIAKAVLARGWDRGLSPAERQFVYMPLMHSEAIADQRLSVRLFAALPRRWGLDFARSHHRVVARFGRFPHRNAVLGRKSSDAERRAVRRGAAW